MKTYTAYTSEVDDAGAAVADILKQLGGLRTNTVGYISCHADFVDSGVYSAVCAALPFEVIGTTTNFCSNGGADEFFNLSLLVLTSDTATFATGLTEPLVGNDPAVVETAYLAAENKLGSKPALILSSTPLMVNISGDFFANVFDRVSGGVPNFGTLAIDETEDYHRAAVLYNGEAHRDRLAFILIKGDINPRFYVTGISNEKIFLEKGVVTASSGNLLREIDGAPVYNYLEHLGLSGDADGGITGVNSFPFIVDVGDGTPPVVRAIFLVTPDGCAVCGGDIPVGATITVGAIDGDEIKAMSQELAQSILDDGEISCMLIFSCIGRFFSLGYDSMGELSGIKSILEKSDVAYAFAYSGGELCPVYNKEGKLINKNHNDTLIICAF